MQPLLCFRERRQKLGKIYVISAGSYSDYTVYGATTDPDRANDMKLKITAWCHDEAVIEEYEDGVFENERIDSIIPTTYYRVHLYNYTDPIIQSYVANSDLKPTVHEIPQCNNAPQDRNRRHVVISNICADNEKQAFKIACDKVAEYQAQRNLII